MTLGDPIPTIIVKVEDNRSCCLESLIDIQGAVNPDKFGIYPISYSVEDEEGNPAELNVEVTVSLAPESYLDQTYIGVDSCESGIYNYIAAVQDCTCPDDKVQVINLGNFGPSAIFDFDLSGTFLEVIDFSKTIGDIDFQGDGVMSCDAQLINLTWTLDNGASADLCQTTLSRQ
ncbi:MAG: hypothetical protein ACI959_000555 [Limisphaerales bacterium]|jgi:hypothetical protein